MNLVFLFAFSCFGNHRLRKIQKCSNEKDIESLADIVMASKHTYLREEAIREMSSFSAALWTQKAKDIALQCVASERESCHVRGYCSYALGQAEEFSAVETIISAMEQCDAESRYWMLLGLEPLAKESSLARAQIESLKQDVDLFIRARSQAGK